ncbi:MAG: MFS transporter [Ktedonobacteraceae bacterium]|nr:MFS transporter [Ktedonobacteraceae bacterium]
MSFHPSSREEGNISVAQPVVEPVAATDQQKATKQFSPGSILAPLRNRNFALLFSGQLISIMGDGLYYVALPWFMLSSGGGAQALGIVLAAYGIPRAASVLFGGVLSDRLGPRNTMLLTDCVRIVLMAALAFLVAQGHPALWLLCFVSALFGLFGGLFLPASLSAAPAILRGEELQAGNALTASSGQLAGVVGVGAAGAVVAWLQPAGALGLDALTFVVSAVTLLFMQNVIVSQASRAAKDNENAGETGEAAVEPLTFWQLLRRSRILQLILVLATFKNLGIGAMFEVALPAMLHDQLHTSASGYGFILAGFSVGSILGALTAGGLGKLPYRLLLSLASFCIGGVLLTLLPFMGSVGIGVLIMAATGMLFGLGNVIALSVVQGAIPAHLMGRVMSMFGFATYGVYPFSVAIGGVITPRYGVIPIFLAGGLLMIIPAVVGFLQRSFWQRGEVKLTEES